MNILYLLFSFTTGGTERLVVDICNEMVNREHNVYLYIVNNLYEQSMLDTLDPRIQVYLQNRSAGGGDKLKTLFTVARYICDNKINVVHCNSFDAPDLLLLKPIFFPKTKIIHTIHDVGQYASLGSIKCALRNLLCHRFIAISNCVKDDIITHGGIKDKVRVVYNSINLTRFTPRKKAPEQVVRIGHVARIMPEKKGQDVLLHAISLICKNHSNIHCYFAGDADSAHKEAFSALKKQAVDLGLSQHVTFLGNIEDIPALLSTLDVFVLPSRYEGFGISLIEAMAMGLPCIASRLDGPAEVLQNGKYGTLFNPGDSQDLAEKLSKVILQLPQYKAAAEKSICYVKQAYNIVTMCDHLEQIMHE